MGMTRSKRMSDRNDYIAQRIRQTAYKAWYQMHLKPTETGTIFKVLNRIR